MEALLALLAFGLLVALLALPIMVIVTLVKARRLERDLADLRRDLLGLEARVSAAIKTGRLKAPDEAGARVVVSAPPPVRRESVAESVTPTPSAMPPPVPAAEAPSAPLPSPLGDMPSTLSPGPVHEEVFIVPAAAAAIVPEQAGPVRPTGALLAATPSRTAVAPMRETPALAAADGSTIGATGTPVGPPTPRSPRPGQPPPAVPAGVDWEGLLGLKGAAWVGGIAIIIAAVFLARIAWGHFTAPLQMATLVLGGVLALAWAELSLRRGYEVTANAVSGAGIAVLYIAFYAGRVYWDLIPAGPTFVLMALVTVIAGAVAVRYDAQLTAVLGLLGGFATPALLSTGEDRPIALFSYVLLLNVGLMAVAVKKRWHGLVLPALACTFLIEVGWFIKFMAPGKLLIGLVAFGAVGLLYLLLPLVAHREESPALRYAAAIGGSLPLVFTLFLSLDRAFVADWPLLFFYVALLDVALGAVALMRGRLVLLGVAACATTLILPLWATQGLLPGRVWGPVLGAAALTLLLNSSLRVARRFAPQIALAHRAILEGVGVAVAFGLGLFAAVLAVGAPTRSPWPFTVLLLVLLGIFVERTGNRGRLPGVSLLAPIALAMLAQIWFQRITSADTLLRDLAVPLLLAVAVSLIAARRSNRAFSGPEDEGGSVGATAVAMVGLFACLLSASRGSDPRPLFGALAVGVLLLVASALRQDWTWLLPTALAGSGTFALSWQLAYFQPEDLSVALLLYGAFYVGFLALPFLVGARLRDEWRQRPAAWWASALAGPVFFLPLHQALTRGLGKAAIGLLPLALAVLQVAVLAGIARVFPAAPLDERRSGHRLGYLALFAAIALGFVAIAIPLQLDRQWITVGWALEALAVFWIFGRLPHPGLKLFGAILFTFVGARLLLNWPNLLRYQERGMPILNWFLYTYGVPAVCCLLGARWLRAAEEGRRDAREWDLLPGDRVQLVRAVYLLGLILVFALINLEIVDYYSTGAYVELSVARKLARDLTMSVAWGLYSMALLVIGLVQKKRGVRLMSLSFLLLTVGKVFLHDLSSLAGVHRVLSFLGLGVALIVVSLLYQRFVLAKERG